MAADRTQQIDANQAVVQLLLEGFVAKRKASTYRPLRRSGPGQRHHIRFKRIGQGLQLRMFAAPGEDAHGVRRMNR